MDSFSFAPILGADPRILILGTMPGQRSLDEGQYYAHPQNQFWKIMGDLYGAHRSLPYPARVNILTARKIAVWDVIHSCKRKGSMDSAMRDIVLNDFEKFYAAHGTIKYVMFDSGKAEQLYNKHILPHLSHRLEYFRLPSPSPAYASVPYARKLEIWRDTLLPLG